MIYFLNHEKELCWWEGWLVWELSQHLNYSVGPPCWKVPVRRTLTFKHHWVPVNWAWHKVKEGLTLHAIESMKSGEKEGFLKKKIPVCFKSYEAGKQARRHIRFPSGSRLSLPWPAFQWRQRKSRLRQHRRKKGVRAGNKLFSFRPNGPIAPHWAMCLR